MCAIWVLWIWILSILCSPGTPRTLRLRQAGEFERKGKVLAQLWNTIAMFLSLGCAPLSERPSSVSSPLEMSSRPTILLSRMDLP